MTDQRPLSHVAVVGGGISGLAAAHRLTELRPELKITLLEASNRAGGILQTVREQGYLIEQSADSFLTTLPDAIGLCRRIGIEQDLIETNSVGRRALVVRGGEIYPVPEGFVLMAPRELRAIATTRLLSWSGKLRLASEYFVARRTSDTDESLASFVRRRFGREVFERLVQPLVGGIYTADPEKLSVAATMPQFFEMEREFGSLIRAMRHGKKMADGTKPDGTAADQGARYSMFVTPRDGLGQLVEALCARLPEESVRLNQRVEQVVPLEGGGWQIQLAQQPAPLEVDGIILATRAPDVASMTRNFDVRLAEQLEAIPYAGASVVVLGYRQEQFARLPAGFGFVVPAVERRQILAASFSSNKFAGRAPEGHVLVRVFIGGALQGELAEQPEDRLVEIATSELAQLCGISGEPDLVRVSRWLGAMPQYHVGHLERVADIERLAEAHSHFALAGNAYRGVGIPQCIQSGERAAESVCQGKT